MGSRPDIPELTSVRFGALTGGLTSRDGAFVIRNLKPQGSAAPSRFLPDGAAHAAGDEDAGDDALLVERIGGSVATVEGEAANLKVTFPADLALAEAWLP